MIIIIITMLMIEDSEYGDNGNVFDDEEGNDDGGYGSTDDG